MGLDTSHDCWHGAYSRFNRFRMALVKAAGWETKWVPSIGVTSEQADRFGLRREEPAIWHDHDWPEEVYDGVWETDPDDPLVVLIVHSDCDGEIPTRFAIPLAERLEELIPDLPDDPPGRGHRSDAEQFAIGLRIAGSKGEDVIFS